MSYFDFSNYKDLLEELIENHKSIPGVKARMAKAAGIQPAYLSHVLHAEAQLTPDHAFALTRFFKLPPLEAEYFLLLVDLERGSNPEYRRHLTQKANAIKAEAKKQLTRIDETTLSKMPPEFYEFYYRSGVPSVVHVALSVEGLQTEAALLQNLKILPTELAEVLHGLKKFGLVEKRGSKWTPLSYQTHLSKDSPWLRMHALNWRLRAVEKVSEAETLSYTDVCSLSLEDEQEFQEECSKLIKKFRKKVAASRGEAVLCLNFDFFRV